MSATSTIQQLETTGDYVLLSSNQAYVDYFAMMDRAFKALKAWYKQIKGADVEEQIIGGYIDRIMNTLRLIALKCEYAERPMLRLDLNDSGYPHVVAIQVLEADLLRNRETLLNLSTQPMLKEEMLTHLAKSDEEPTELLEAMSLRRYFEQLKQEEIILPFTPGELEHMEENDTRRQYLYSWLFFDGGSSVPHIYIMAFEHDVTEPSLELSEPARNELFEVCKRAGSNVSHLQSIATAIDEAIEAVHPKILKRIKLGPIMSVEHSREEHPFLEYLRKGGRKFDFTFHVRTEIVFSRRQVEKTKGFFGTRQVREVFDVPLDDIECARAGVSTTRRLLLLPHHVSQQINLTDESLSQYNTMATYTKEGEVHAI